MMMPRALPILLALFLAACSSGSEGTQTQGLVLLNLLKDQVAARKTSATASAAGNTAVLLTREQLAGITDPLMRVRVEKTNAFSLLYIAQRNGGDQVWASPDKASVTIRAGMITQTKGLGYDLYASEAPQMLAVLQGNGRPGPANRVHRVMDGSNAVTAIRYDCVIADVGQEQLVILNRAYTATHFKEDCTNPLDSFTNEYWRDTSGVVRASRQRISPEFGFVFTERLID